MIKIGGVVEDGQNVQRAKYIISTTVGNDTITLNGAELIPINWEGRLETEHSVSVNELGKQLLKAAADGEIGMVRQLLTRGAPFTADWLGTSPLHLAALNNHLEITEILLRAGISKDARTKVDRTPLHMAAYEGHLEIVDTLLKHGCDMNSRDLLDMTPLHWAVQNGHIEIVEHLVKNGAVVEVPSKFDVTPTMIAQQIGRADIEQILVNALNNTAIATQNLVLQLNAEGANPVFNGEMELEASDNQEFSGYSVINEPILIDDDCQEMDQESSQDGIEQEDEETDHERIETENLVQGVTVDSNALTNSLKILEEHGITMLQNDENDDGNILNSVMESGHSVVLTDVGKEVLNSVKQSEQRKHSQTFQMDKKIVSVTPEQFLAMTNSNRSLKQMKVMPTLVMKKKRIIPISSAPGIIRDLKSVSSNHKEQPSQRLLEMAVKQLKEARKTIEEYKIKLKQKEREAQKYKLQLKLLLDRS